MYKNGMPKTDKEAEGVRMMARGKMSAIRRDLSALTGILERFEDDLNQGAIIHYGHLGDLLFVEDKVGQAVRWLQSASEPDDD